MKWTSLLWTAQEGHAEVAKLLLERGADPTIPDKVSVMGDRDYVVIHRHTCRLASLPSYKQVKMVN